MIPRRVSAHELLRSLAAGCPSVEVRPSGCYPLAVTAKPAEFPSEVIRSEQAARIAAMLERWTTEDVSDEPDWDVDQVERIVFSSKPATGEPADS